MCPVTIRERGRCKVSAELMPDERKLLIERGVAGLTTTIELESSLEFNNLLCITGLDSGLDLLLSGIQSIDIGLMML